MGQAVGPFFVSAAHRVSLPLSSIPSFRLRTPSLAAVESTNSRVAWFTVLEAVSLIAVSLGQLYVVKTWFKTGDRGILGSGGGGGGGGGRMGP